MRTTLYGTLLAAGLWIGSASPADAQVTYSLGSPISGPSVTIGNPNTAYAQPGYGNYYTRPGYGNAYRQPVYGGAYAQPSYVQPSYARPNYVQPPYRGSYAQPGTAYGPTTYSSGYRGYTTQTPAYGGTYDSNGRVYSTPYAGSYSSRTYVTVPQVGSYRVR